tara:strand:- start:224 stop:472 length:249 start_codon:yes stop_codon:yes gene_type:complete|eukprot:scaffold47700_cov25-Phaeocystis_antarctica.AAC.2
MRLTLIVTILGELNCLQNGLAASRPSMRRAATPLMQTDRDGPFVGPRTTPLLDQVDTPSDMKGFSISELKQLSHELRCSQAP